jgi:glycosyltransferase involved in cell wall biosynthesis
MFESTLILIPAHNESASVAKIIAAARNRAGCPILVIDDASSDSTTETAKAAGAEVLRLPIQLGAWGAAQAGIRYALKNDYNYVITMDADGQHEASDLKRLMTPVYEKQADVSIGACISRGSLLRKFAWVFLKWTSGLSMEDITSGFRAYNYHAMQILASRESTLLEYQDIGVLTQLRSHHLDIVEIPVQMLPRADGHSRVFNSWLAVGYYMFQASILGLSKRHRKTSKR